MGRVRVDARPDPPTRAAACERAGGPPPPPASGRSGPARPRGV